jgi:hypothetical protein
VGSGCGAQRQAGTDAVAFTVAGVEAEEEGDGLWMNLARPLGGWGGGGSVPCEEFVALVRCWVFGVGRLEGAGEM